jgi:hypothetical protein
MLFVILHSGFQKKTACAGVMRILDVPWGSASVDVWIAERHEPAFFGGMG